jgi:hypothetical protein
VIAPHLAIYNPVVRLCQGVESGRCPDCGSPAQIEFVTTKDDAGDQTKVTTVRCSNPACASWCAPSPD